MPFPLIPIDELDRFSRTSDLIQSWLKTLPALLDSAREAHRLHRELNALCSWPDLPPSLTRAEAIQRIESILGQASLAESEPVAQSPQAALSQQAIPYCIVRRDNFRRSGEVSGFNETIVDLTFLSETRARLIAQALNEESGENSCEYYRAAPLGTKHQAFEA